MDYDQIREFYQQNFYYIIAVQIAFGALLGAIPLILGIRNKRRNLGLISFVVTVVLATVSPIVAMLFAVVFTLVVRRRPSGATELEDADSDNSDVEKFASDGSHND